MTFAPKSPEETAAAFVVSISRRESAEKRTNLVVVIAVRYQHAERHSRSPHNTDAACQIILKNVSQGWKSDVNHAAPWDRHFIAQRNHAAIPLSGESGSSSCITIRCRTARRSRTDQPQRDTVYVPRSTRDCATLESIAAPGTAGQI